MNQDRLREILSVNPAEQEVASRSARARYRAIATYQATSPERRWHSPVAAVALAILLLGVWFAQRLPRPAPASQATERPRIEMNLQLSDGTRVNWVIDDRYAL